MCGLPWVTNSSPRQSKYGECGSSNDDEISAETTNEMSRLKRGWLQVVDDLQPIDPRQLVFYRPSRNTNTEEECYESESDARKRKVEI